MRFLVFLLVCCFFSTYVFTANAQGHSAYCDQADSTAASQTCLKKHLDSAQKKLNQVYIKLTDKIEGVNLDELKELQNTWLRYRDAECMWEAERSITPALKRINELSCMARVTEDRLDLLTIALADSSEEGSQREYGSFPRWMNVVAKDNADVYWDYGKRISFDLDCDDEDEFIMQGVTTKEMKSENSKDNEDKTSSLNFEKNVVVAIAQNPQIGRPTVKTFTFPVKDKEGVESVCTDAVTLTFSEKAVDVKEEEKETDETKSPACKKILNVNSKGCKPKIISWAGKDFILEIEETENKNKEEVKK